MLQRIQGLDVYVVNFDTMPELPITGIGEEAIYAEALTAAFQNGDIIEPGKYGIHVDAETKVYNVFKIVE
jgi:hypothetical protein